MNFATHFVELFLASAPWLLLGLILAGMLKMFISMEWMNQQLGGHDLKTTIKAALMGAPLPLCSCGVIPAAIGLRRSGASKAATTSFLVSTPETGVDSISVSYVLLGPFMAIVRPIAAICSAVFAGLLVGKEEALETGLSSNTKQQDRSHTVEKETAVKSCCTNKKETPVTSCCTKKEGPVTSCCSKKTVVNQKAVVAESCCSKKQASRSEVTEPSFYQKVLSGLQYAGTKLIDDTVIWLLIGLGFAAAVQAYVPNEFLSSWGTGVLAMLVMVVVSVPMYICATASTPIAAGFLLAGVAPGAVLVFMMAGPATNIATLGVVYRELGRRALVAYLSGVLGGAMFFGFLVDALVAKFDIQVMPQVGAGQQAMLPDTLVVASGVLLAVLMLVSMTKKVSTRVHALQAA